MTRIKILLCIVAVFLFWGPPPAAFAIVYIDIDSPAFKKLPIAITDFRSPPGKAQPQDMAVWFADALAKSLDMTGYFQIVSRKAFLEDPGKAGTTLGTFQFSDWSAIGAEYVVKGVFQLNGTGLEAEMRLFDVVRGKLMVGKKYTGKRETRQDVIRQFSAEILYALTGERGVFDTKIAFIIKSGKGSDIFTMNFDGTELLRLTTNQSLTVSPRWSPYGRSLAYTSYRDGNPDLYIRDMGRGQTRKAASYDGLNLPGSWSNDGGSLYITLSKDGNEEIYALEVFSKRLKRLTYNPAIDVSPALSPDGSRIAFVSDRSGSPQIYVMGVDGENVRRLTSEGSYNTSPAWNPKGKKVAYEGRAGGRYQIFTVDEDGSNPLQLTFDPGDNEHPSWSPDGRYIVYSTRGAGKGRISIINADGSSPRVLYEGGACMSPAWSPHLQ